MFFGAGREMAATGFLRTRRPWFVMQLASLYGDTFKAFPPLQVASKTSVPRAASHMRGCPVLTGWPADGGNNRHANAHVKPETVKQSQLRQYKSQRGGAPEEMIRTEQWGQMGKCERGLKRSKKEMENLHNKICQVTVEEEECNKE